MFSKAAFVAACITGVVVGGVAGVIMADDSAGEFWKAFEIRNLPARPKIGVYTAEPGRTLAAQLGVDRKKAFVITGLVEGGAAERAGLRTYDVVTRLDGSTDADQSDLRRALSRKSWGDVIEVQVIREGQTLDFVVPLDRAPKLGVYTAEPGTILAAQFGLDPAKSFVITGLVDGGAAERAGLREYDIIRRIDDSDDAGVEGLNRALAKKSSREVMSLEVLRDGQPMYFIVPLQPAKELD